jgi:hypothetical protein
MSEERVPYPNRKYPRVSSRSGFYEPIEVIASSDAEFDSADNIVEASTYNNPPRKLRRRRRTPPLEFKGLRIRLAVIRDADFDPETAPATSDPDAVVGLMREAVETEPLECMWVIPVTSQHRVLGIYEAARGHINSVSILPVDVLRAVIAVGAQAFILVHNHPSGHPDMSIEDRELTKRMAIAAASVGVAILDSISIGVRGRFHAVSRESPALLRP